MRRPENRFSPPLPQRGRRARFGVEDGSVHLCVNLLRSSFLPLPSSAWGKWNKIAHQSTLPANGPPVSVRPRPDSAHSALARRDTIELVFEDGGRRKREEEEKTWKMGKTGM